MIAGAGVSAGAGAIEGAEKLPVRPAFERVSACEAVFAGEEKLLTAAAAEPPTGALTAPTETTWAQAWGAMVP